MRQKSFMIVEPNNSGFAKDEFNEHVEKARRTATNDYYIGNYISLKLKYPLLVPLFPRPDSCWKVYTHALDRDVVLQKANNLERLDLQLLAMIEDAKNKLGKMGYEIDKQFLMTGFSASGTFVNRFTLIHPDRVLTSAAGGLNGLLMLPVEEMDGKKLNYPVGINDFHEIFGKQFDSVSFKSTPQFLFMGEKDNNDAIPYEDAFDIHESELIFKLLGEEMQPVRWNSCIAIYRQNNINTRIVTYDEIGHEHPESVKEDILLFFQTVIKE